MGDLFTMYGAILGDIIGSRFEFNNIKSKEFKLFDNTCQFTDDTILTCAAADWIVNGASPEEKLVFWANKYISRTHFGHTAFSPGFMNWVSCDNRKPYQAKTNGCLMRVSPIAFFEKNTKKAIEKAVEFTSITHNHEESINAVIAYVKIIHSVISGCSNDKIIKIGEEHGYNFISDVDTERQKMDKFYFSCNKTFAPAIVCVLEAKSYEDAIRNAVSLGGDSDTLACIAGAVAEAKFGIPENIAKQGIEFLDNDIKMTLSALYNEEQNKYKIYEIAKNKLQR